MNRDQWEQQEWTSSLCGCCASDVDWTLLCNSWWCPCIQFGENVEAAGLGDHRLYCTLQLLIACCTCCPCLLPTLKRSELREKYNLEGGACGDCYVHYFCHCCALIQEAREIKARGRRDILGEVDPETVAGVAITRSQPHGRQELLANLKEPILGEVKTEGAIGYGTDTRAGINWNAVGSPPSGWEPINTQPSPIVISKESKRRISGETKIGVGVGVMENTRGEKEVVVAGAVETPREKDVLGVVQNERGEQIAIAGVEKDGKVTSVAVDSEKGVVIEKETEAITTPIATNLTTTTTTTTTTVTPIATTSAGSGVVKRRVVKGSAGGIAEEDAQGGVGAIISEVIGGVIGAVANSATGANTGEGGIGAGGEGGLGAVVGQVISQVLESAGTSGLIQSNQGLATTTVATETSLATPVEAGGSKSITESVGTVLGDVVGEVLGGVLAGDSKGAGAMVAEVLGEAVGSVVKAAVTGGEIGTPVSAIGGDVQISQEHGELKLEGEVFTVPESSTHKKKKKKKKHGASVHSTPAHYPSHYQTMPAVASTTPELKEETRPQVVTEEQVLVTEVKEKQQEEEFKTGM